MINNKPVSKKFLEFKLQRQARLLKHFTSMKKIFFDTSRIMIDDDELKQMEYLKLLESIINSEMQEISYFIQENS